MRVCYNSAERGYSIQRDSRLVQEPGSCHSWTEIWGQVQVAFNNWHHMLPQDVGASFSMDGCVWFDEILEKPLYKRREIPS